MKYSIVAALLCILLAACGGNDTPDATATPTFAVAATATSTPEAIATPAPTASPTPSPTPTPRPRPEANPFPPDLQAESLALLNQLAALRGIDEPQPVDMFLLSRDQARAFYTRDEAPQANVTPTPGPRPLDPRQELYELLGLVPEVVEGTDTPTVEQQEVDNLIAIITGFYDHGYRAFYMIETINGGINGLLARSTIVHELTHALQYQTIDIDKLTTERDGNSDAFTALLSFMEGDAVNSEIELLGFSTRSTLRQPTCFQIPPSRNTGTPYAIERELDVWYEDGLCFVQAIAARNPDGLQAVYENPPATMEQILHPEKYLAGETAITVTPRPLHATLGGGWSDLGSGTFGEFGLQNILLNGLPNDRSLVQAGAAGWGGDAWRLYVSGDSRLLHLETVWDTAPDAPEFRDALLVSLVNLGFSSATRGATTMLTAGDRVWSVTVQGDAVTVLVANDSTALEAATQTLGLP